MSYNPHDPQANGHPPQQPQFGSQPQSQFGSQPQSQFGSQPQQQPAQSQFGSQPQSQFGSQPQSQFGSQPQQSQQPQYGSQPQQQPAQQQQFGSQPGQWGPPPQQPAQPHQPHNQPPHQPAQQQQFGSQPGQWGPPPQQPAQPHQPHQQPSHQQPSHHQPPHQPQQQFGAHVPDHSANQVFQRTYAEGRFAPSNTQALRIQNRVQTHQGAPAHAPWTTQVINVSPKTGKQPSDTGDLIRLVIALALGGLLVLTFAVIFVIIMFNTGLVAFVALLLSSLPLLFIIGMVMWFDRWKPQPKVAQGLCVLWGGAAAVVLTLALQFPLKGLMSSAGVTDENGAIGAVVLAPIFEEFTKGLILVVIVVAARRYFEGPLDGWVYGSLAGAGFAFTENILYLSGAYVSGAEDGVGGISLTMTFVMRCLMSPLLHSTFTMCAGVSIGLAARRGQWWTAVIMWAPGLFLGMILHASWNGLATFLPQPQGSLATVLIMQFISVLIPSLIISAFWFATAIFLQFNETKTTRANLGDYANAGWITHEEVEMLGTWKGRRAGKRWARQFPGGLQYMKQMIKTSANLATTRMRVVAGIGGADEHTRERFYLDNFTKNRAGLMRAAGQQGGF